MLDTQSDLRMVPVMSADEVACYRRHLSNVSALLEYGVGASTVLAAESGVRSLYSIDTDRDWVAKTGRQEPVARMMADGRAKLVHADLGPIKKWGKPCNYAYFMRWPDYARLPWQDGFKPDLVLVDGRFRSSCILQALKNGGPDLKIAVHDFWKRPFYHGVLRFVSVLERVGTLAILQSNGVDDWRNALLGLRHRYDRR